MKTARSSVPLALIRDRWILAMGGNIGRAKPCSLVAAYDTLTNVWFDCQSLPTVKANTSAVVVSQRFVYLLPGQNVGAQKGNSVLVDYLDTGATQDYTGQHESVQYGMQIAKRSWESLEVRDAVFCRQMPSCGFVSNDGVNWIITFGGQGVNQFMFRQQDIVKGTVEIKPMRASFKEKPGFCTGSDHVIKYLNSKVYAVDASNGTLYCLDMNLNQWT